LFADRLALWHYGIESDLVNPLKPSFTIGLHIEHSAP